MLDRKVDEDPTLDRQVSAVWVDCIKPKRRRFEVMDNRD
jgi:hypothetical protein